MLIGAYRDNEVNAAHPLMRKLEAISDCRRTREGDHACAARPEHLRAVACGRASLRAGAQPRRWRNWCREDGRQSVSSPFSSFLRSPKKECSPSIMMLRAGPGIWTHSR